MYCLKWLDLGKLELTSYDRSDHGLSWNPRRHGNLDREKGGCRQLLTRVPVVVLRGSRPSSSGVCQPDGIPPANQEPLQSLCFLRETCTLLSSFPTYSLFEPRSQFDGHIQGSLLSAKVLREVTIEVFLSLRLDFVAWKNISQPVFHRQNKI